GIERGGQMNATQNLGHQPATAGTHGKADTHLLHEFQQDRKARVGAAVGQQMHQGNGQEDRHRIIGARFDFQGGTGSFFEFESGQAQQAEHGGGIGGADDGADQQRFEPRQFENPVSGGTGNGGGDQHAHGGE